MAEQIQLSSEDSRRLRKVFDQALPSWNEWTSAPPEVEPGSSLDGDVKIYPHVGALAWQSITSAVDHLKAVRDLWMKAGGLHAFADATLLRAALLAAATALYLLDDSAGVVRRERVKRAALAALSDHRDHLQHQLAMAEMTASLGADATATHQGLIAQLQTWAARADGVAQEHGATKKERDRGLVANQCILQASRVLSRDLPRSEQLRLQSGIRAVWQKGSADAHSRRWQTMSRRSVAGSPLLGPDVTELVTGLNAATLVLNEAWRLWHLRRINHVQDLIPTPGTATPAV